MGLFICSKCEAVDNTALGAYWDRWKEPLCSECETGAWHDQFPKETLEQAQARGSLLDYRLETPDGYYLTNAHEKQRKPA